MFDPNSLSPTHRELIEDARRHVDRRLLPPVRVRGRARLLLAEKLIGLGVAELVAGGENVWWIDPDSGATGLRLVVVDAEADDAVVVPPSTGSVDTIIDKGPKHPLVISPALPEPPAPIGHLEPPVHLAEATLAHQPIEPRPWTKIARVLCLLRHPEGTNLPALIAATGWLPHTARAALTGLRRKGHAIVAFKLDGQTIYRIDPDTSVASEVGQDGDSLPLVGSA